MKNFNRLQILKENYSQNEGELTFREYVELVVESDPYFFNWFFGSESDNIGDFGMGMSKDQEIEYNEFINSL